MTRILLILLAIAISMPGYADNRIYKRGETKSNPTKSPSTTKPGTGRTGGTSSKGGSTSRPGFNIGGTSVKKGGNKSQGRTGTSGNSGSNSSNSSSSGGWTDGYKARYTGNGEAAGSIGGGGGNRYGDYEFVDLGLSVDWATMNVGASTPGDYGWYFAWGNVLISFDYSESNCTLYNSSRRSITGMSDYDAATGNWGSGWYTPTKEEMDELVENCTFTEATYNGVKGFKVTSNRNGNWIFLPSGGWKYDESEVGEEEYGFYWTSTSTSSNEAVSMQTDNSDGTAVVFSYYRNRGLNIRAVHRKGSGSSSSSRTTTTTTSNNGKYGDHEYVDLGLSVNWAKTNVGASTPGQYGWYFSWGSVLITFDYTESSCKMYNSSMKNIAGNSDYDPATGNWGSGWYTPTKAEMDELVQNCTFTEATYDGVKGYKVTSNRNGNWIFLPSGGWKFDNSEVGEGEYGFYWSSTGETDHRAISLKTNATGSAASVFPYYRNRGLNIRPVHRK